MFVMCIDQLGTRYDASYGRWVSEFTQQPEEALAKMFSYLRPGGLLAYEACSTLQTAYFSHPHHDCIGQWHALMPKIFDNYGYPLRFGDAAYHAFKTLNCQNINTQINQAILKTQEEKSVYCLGLLGLKSALFENEILSEQAFDDLYADCLQFEKSTAISGFFQNILVSGRAFG